MSWVIDERVTARIERIWIFPIRPNKGTAYSVLIRPEGWQHDLAVYTGPERVCVELKSTMDQLFIDGKNLKVSELNREGEALRKRIDDLRAIGCARRMNNGRNCTISN